VERYLYTTRRYRWIIAAILLVLGLFGSAAAYTEYNSSFESDATIWVSRTSQDLLQVTGAATDQPSVPNFLTPGSEYAEVFGQLIQAQTFLRQVIGRTSLSESFAAARDPLAFLDDVRKRFRVQALGTNLVKITYRSDSPEVAFEMVSAALTERDARAAEQQLGAISVTTAFYQKEFDLAQQEALRAQQDLDKFNSTHSGNLNTADDFTQRQLRLASDLAQARLNDLKTRIDRTAISSALLQLTEGADNQVLDAPQIQPRPSGGLRQAALVFGVMMIGAVLLGTLLVVAGTLLTASVASEADLARLGGISLLATIPQLDRRRREGIKSRWRSLSAKIMGQVWDYDVAPSEQAVIDLRTALATAAFGSDEEDSVVPVVSGAAS
jgi:hypothetical protein